MKKLSLLIILTTISYLLTTTCGYALDLGFARPDGGRPGAFLQYGAGARSLGMGKAFVGVADDASAVYWNPAGLAQLRQKEFMALQSKLYVDTDYSFAAGVYPAYSGQETGNRKNYGTMGLALINLTSTGFQLRDEYNYELGEGGVNETAMLLSLAKSLELGVSSKISLGTTFKLVNQNVDTRRDTGYGVDFGLLWRAANSLESGDSRIRQMLKPLSIGLSLQNIVAPRIKLKNREDVYPLSATLGLGYKTWQDKLLIALDLNQTENRALKTHVGAEYIIAGILALRAGLDETEAALGAGIKWRNYALDYAFGYHDAWPGQGDLGASHRFGLTMKWGNAKQMAANSSELGEKTEAKDQELQTISYKLPTDFQLLSPNSSPKTEERLKQEIKEQIEKQTGEKVTNVEIEKMEEVECEKTDRSSEIVDSSMIKEKLQTTNSKLLAYEVKPGDCLWSIAGKTEIYNNPWNWLLIYEANKEQIKNPNLIYPGQVLKIPRQH